MVNDQKLDNLGVEFDIVQVGDALLLRAEHGGTKARGQVRCGHFILGSVRGDDVQMLHEHLERLVDE